MIPNALLALIRKFEGLRLTSPTCARPDVRINMPPISEPVAMMQQDAEVFHRAAQSALILNP